ncbi:MAG: LD-carboxypeptidase [Acidobacteria bacterium]|nr:LD-carboxypeptidase [Acidobacteriota bacterium]
MNRRELLKAAVVLPFLAPAALAGKSRSKLIKPKRIAGSDTIGVVAPSSGLSKEDFDKAIGNLESMGFRTKIGKSARARNGFLAGTDKERLDDLHAAFADKDVKAVWCLRGGYGAGRILPQIDFKLIAANPKILIGYSDITALHLAISQNTGLVTFHGPVATSAPVDYTKNNTLNVLMNPTATYRIELSEYNRTQASNLFKTEVITAGKARGRLTGGNLSLVSALAGTPYGLRDTKGKLLFLEDVGEQPYRIDRMLTQLRQSIDMKQLSGIALGVFEDCNPKAPDTQSLIDVLRDRLGDLGIPVIYGLSFGHIREQFTLPMGIEAEMDTATATVTFLEPAVS